jgi:hypothetical protein
MKTKKQEKTFKKTLEEYDMRISGKSALGFLSCRDLKQIIDEKFSYVVDYFKTHELARQVALGQKSYVEETQFIQKEYRSIWNQFSLCKEDPLFNKNVEQIVSSIEDIGEHAIDSHAENIWKKPFYKKNQKLSRFTLNTLTSLSVALIPLTMGSPDGNHLVVSIPRLVYSALSGSSAFFATWFYTKALDFSSNKFNLNCSAENTDEYLRQFKEYALRAESELTNKQ